MGTGPTLKRGRERVGADGEGEGSDDPCQNFRSVSRVCLSPVGEEVPVPVPAPVGDRSPLVSPLAEEAPFIGPALSEGGEDDDAAGAASLPTSSPPPSPVLAPVPMPVAAPSPVPVLTRKNVHIARGARDRMRALRTGGYTTLVDAFEVLNTLGSALPDAGLVVSRLHCALGQSGKTKPWRDACGALSPFDQEVLLELWLCKSELLSLFEWVRDCACPGVSMDTLNPVVVDVTPASAYSAILHADAPGLLPFRLSVKGDPGTEAAAKRDFAWASLQSLVKVLAWVVAREATLAADVGLREVPFQAWVKTLAEAVTKLWNGPLVATEPRAVAPLVRVLLDVGELFLDLTPDVDTFRVDAAAALGMAAAALTRNLPSKVSPGSPSFSMDTYTAVKGVFPPDMDALLETVLNYAARLWGLLHPKAPVTFSVGMVPTALQAFSALRSVFRETPGSWSITHDTEPYRALLTDE